MTSMTFHTKTAAKVHSCFANTRMEKCSKQAQSLPPPTYVYKLRRNYTNSYARKKLTNQLTTRLPNNKLLVLIRLILLAKVSGAY